ncbi:MAG: TolC family protein [Sulfuricaulis sp.]
MFRYTAALLLGLLFLGGCASYRPQTLSPHATAQAFSARSLNDPGLRRYLEKNIGRGASVRWDFPRLMLAAEYYHPDIALTRAQWRTAQAGVVAAGGRPNPSALTSVQRNLDAVGVSPWTLGLDLNFTLETAGKRGDRIAQARYLAEAARQRLAAVTWQVASRLRRRLLMLYQAQQNEIVLQRLETAQARYVAVLDERRAAGDLASFELSQMRVALDATRLRMRAAEKQAAVARARVADAVGVPAPALAGVDLALSLFDHPAFAADALGPDLRTQALQRRPDVLAALADYAAAESRLKLEVARQYPDLQLGPGYTWDQGARKWSLALGFALPFNRNQGPIAVAHAAREEAATRFMALQDKISGELDAAHAEYAAALKQLETADSLLAANAARQRVLRQRLLPGALSSATRLNAEIELTQAALARLDALVQAQQAFGRVEDAVERPLDPLELPAGTGAHGDTP